MGGLWIAFDHVNAGALQRLLFGWPPAALGLSNFSLGPVIRKTGENERKGFFIPLKIKMMLLKKYNNNKKRIIIIIINNSNIFLQLNQALGS